MTRACHHPFPKSLPLLSLYLGHLCHKKPNSFPLLDIPYSAMKNPLWWDAVQLTSDPPVMAAILKAAQCIRRGAHTHALCCPHAMMLVIAVMKANPLFSSRDATCVRACYLRRA